MIDNSTYISIDIEATGPIPGPFSMISLGAAAYDSSGKLLGTFEINLEELPDSIRDDATMQFWERNKMAWEYAIYQPTEARKAMEAFSDWLSKFNKPVAVCYPAGFDWTFITWYMYYFFGKNPLGFSCLDIKSYAAGVLKRPFNRTAKVDMPADWFTDRPHTHKALDDALEQGDMFANMLRYNNGLSKINS